MMMMMMMMMMTMMNLLDFITRETFLIILIITALLKANFKPWTPSLGLQGLGKKLKKTLKKNIRCPD
jgi:hypothetical protein